MIDELFSEWDKSGDGTISYKELSQLLKESKRKSTVTAAATNKLKGATALLSVGGSKSPSPDSSAKS